MKKIVTVEEREERKRRIEQLGSFGSKRTQVVPDATKYNRKAKHKKLGLSVTLAVCKNITKSLKEFTMKKSVTIITTCFVNNENAEGPSTVAITLTPSDVERIEKYISAMADLKKNGLNPSVIDTHDIPHVEFLAEGACNLSPLNPDEYIQLMFLDNEAKKRFDELFTDEANPDEFSTLEDCVYDGRIDTPKLKIRHDDLIWIDGYGKYDGVRMESEGFDLEFLSKVKKELGIEAPAEGVDDPIEYAQEKYLTNPCHCPHCESEDVEGGEVNVDAGGAWQEVTCNECGATWNDVYVLKGFSELKTND